MEVCCLALQILTLFQTKKCHFSHPFRALASKIHTRFQTSLTKSWGQPVASLLRNKDFLKSTSNSHISLSFLFICNWHDTYVHTVSVVSLKTITNSRPKWAKSIPIFRPKWCKNHTLWGSTYLYGLCKGVPPFPGCLFKGQALIHFFVVVE